MQNPKRHMVEHETLVIDDTAECDECLNETHADVASRWPTYPQEELCQWCQRQRTKARQAMKD